MLSSGGTKRTKGVNGKEGMEPRFFTDMSRSNALGCARTRNDDNRTKGARAVPARWRPCSEPPHRRLYATRSPLNRS